jgi:hypothetical protein
MNEDQMKKLPRNMLRFMSFVALGFLTAFFPLSPVEAGGADWKFIGKDDEGLWMYDAETLKGYANDRIKVQTRKIYERKAVLFAVDKYGEKYENLDYVLAEWEIDCFQKKVKLCSAIFYSKENAVLERYYAGEKGCLTPEEIPSDSYSEILRKKVCR